MQVGGGERSRDENADRARPASSRRRHERALSARVALLLAARRGLVVPIWSAQIAAELSRVLLWHGKLDQGRRSITAAEYRRYRLNLYELVHDIDRSSEIVRVATVVPATEEVAWAEARDVDDLHVQLMARAARADCVVSWNHRDFPARQLENGIPRGELSGVVWLTPDQLTWAPGPAS